MNSLYNGLKEKYPIESPDSFKDIYITYVRTLYYYMINNYKKDNNIELDSTILRFVFNLLIKNDDLYINKDNMRIIYNIIRYRSNKLTLCEIETLKYVNETFTNNQAKRLFEINIRSLF